MHLDERREVQGNTSMRLREFPWVQPEKTLKTVCWYLPVLSDSREGTDTKSVYTTVPSLWMALAGTSSGMYCVIHNPVHLL